MRFLLIFMCMATITMLAAALVVIDVIVRLLPLLVVSLVVVAGLRAWGRRRRAVLQSGAHPPAGPAFMPASNTAGIRDMAEPRYARVSPVRPYATAYPPEHTVIDAEVIDAEVISEDEHRG